MRNADHGKYYSSEKKDRNDYEMRWEMGEKRQERQRQSVKQGRDTLEVLLLSS